MLLRYKLKQLFHAGTSHTEEKILENSLRIAWAVVELADSFTLPQSMSQPFTLFWWRKEVLFVLSIAISTILIVLYHTT